MQRIVIVGATSLIAEHCARRWVQQPVQLTLLARNEAQLTRIANDLKIRSSQSDIRCETIDVQDRAQILACAARLFAADGVDCVLVAHGSLPEQKSCENDLAEMEHTLRLNGISPLLFAEAFAKHMANSNSGTIAVISSVAGDRGRRSNYVYGAAKGLVDRYLEGMRHRFAGTGVNIVTIKPGPTRTPMTTSMVVVPTGLAEPDAVAKDIVDGIAAGKSVIYTPAKWRLIMLIIRHLPAFIFNRLNI